MVFGRESLPLPALSCRKRIEAAGIATEVDSGLSVSAGQTIWGGIRTRCASCMKMSKLRE
jgi:hypothetical protein